MDYKEIYQKAFNKEEYSNYSLDIERYKFVLESLGKKGFDNNNSFLDIGVGRGQLSKEIFKLSPKVLSGIDLSKYSDIDFFSFFYELDLNKIDIDIVEGILTNLSVDKEKYSYLSCLDVLEHLEEVNIDNVLMCLSKLGKTCYFTIANHSDKIDDVELHLIQKPKEWWEEKLLKYYKIVFSDVKYDNRLFIYELESL